MKIELIERLSEFGRLGVFVIDVDRRWIVGQRREQDVVHIRYGATDFVDESLPDLEFLEVFPAQSAPPQFSRPKIDTAATLLNGAPPRL